MTDEATTSAAAEPKKRNIWVYIGVSAGVLVALGFFLRDSGGTPELCDEMTHAQIDVIMHGSEVESPAWEVVTVGMSPETSSTGLFAHGDGEAGSSAWKGVDIPVVSEGLRATTTSSELFSHVEYLRIDSEGDDLAGEVFMFASNDGLLQGADNITRRFFIWGHLAANGSPMANQAQKAVDNAPTCMR